MKQKPHQIAVVGAGLSGLVAAFRIRQTLPDSQVSVFEASSNLGGVIETQRQHGFLIELGADSFSVQPPGIVELCEDLGIGDRLIQPLPDHRRAMIVHKGKLVPVPEGFALLRPTDLSKVMASPLLSWTGKLRLRREQWVEPKQDESDESLQSFATRRFGREVFERLIQPLVAGIYTAKADKLSMQATMPQFVELERTHGSMIGATRALQREGIADSARSASGARYGQFRSFPGGIAELFDALQSQIGRESIRLSTRVTSLHRTSGKWRICFCEGDQETESAYDGVILATPTSVSGNLLRNVSPDCSAALTRIPYASSAVAVFGVRDDQVTHPLDCFGLVVPENENRRIIAASFASRKFANRAPEGNHLIRVFMGGATNPQILNHDDETLLRIASEELTDLIGFRGTPSLQILRRWNSAMPQYHVGHCDLRNEIEHAVRGLDGMELTGNGLHGVGISHCVRTANSAANRLAEAVSAADKSDHSV